MGLVACPAVVGVSAVLFSRRDHLEQFRLLNDFRGNVQPKDLAAIAPWACQAMVVPALIDVVERRTFMFRVTRLTARFIVCRAALLLAWLDDIG
jgi:hypothetical protein